MGQVSGQVTYEGQSVGAGVVIFESGSQHIYATAPLDADGIFRFVSAEEVGLPRGSYQVAVRPARVPIETGQPLPPPEKQANIPQRYRDFATSGLAADVVNDVNPFDFELRTQ